MGNTYINIVILRGDFQTKKRVKLGKPSQPLQPPPQVANGIEGLDPPSLYKNHFPSSKLGKPGKIQDPLFAGKNWTNSSGTAGGPGGRDRTLAIKSRKTAAKNTFFS